MDWRSIPPKVIAGLIVAAVVGLFGVYRTWVYPHPNVSIKTVGDERWAPIDFASAPFTVRVKGVVQNSRGRYVYLVVKDPTAEWIQPGLGANVQGEFEGWCYLGISDDPRSMGKSYTIFGVVTDREYGEHEHLDRGTVKAESPHIQVTRTRQHETQEHFEEKRGIQQSNTINPTNPSSSTNKPTIPKGRNTAFSADNLNKITEALLERDRPSFLAKLNIVKDSMTLVFSIEYNDNTRHIFLDNLSYDEFNQVDLIINQNRPKGFILTPVLTLWAAHHIYNGHTTRVEITVCKNPQNIYFSAIDLD